MSNILIHPSDHKNIRDWRRLLDFLDKNLDYSKINSFLDLGAGMSNVGAHILERNPDCRVVSVDTNEELLRKSSKRNSSIEMLNHNINEPIPFDDASFDMVSCIGTLHYNYIKNPRLVLSQMGRVSREFILTDFFVKNSPYSWLLSIRHPSYNARRYSKKGAEDLLGNILGFRVMSCRGGRSLFPDLFPYAGKEVFYLLEKE